MACAKVVIHSDTSHAKSLLSVLDHLILELFCGFFILISSLIIKTLAICIAVRMSIFFVLNFILGIV